MTYPSTPGETPVLVAQLISRGLGKSPLAFRTIGEVATDLGVERAVLRSWETRFSQVRPIKSAGGRRYYRPRDVDLLRRIRSLLYDDGYTVKGVQLLLKDRRRSGPLSREAGTVRLMQSDGGKGRFELLQQAASPGNGRRSEVEKVLDRLRDSIEMLRQALVRA